MKDYIPKRWDTIRSLVSKILKQACVALTTMSCSCSMTYMLLNRWLFGSLHEWKCTGVPNILVSECTPEVIGQMWIWFSWVTQQHCEKLLELWLNWIECLPRSIATHYESGSIACLWHFMEGTSMHFGSVCPFCNVGHADSWLVLPRHPATPALSPQTAQIILKFELNT